MGRVDQKASALLLAISLSIAMAASAMAQDIPRMAPRELAAILGQTELILLDVRAEADWKASDKKIQGALREDPRHVNKWAPAYPKEKTFVLYCA